jgi:hypothetical protein
VRTADLRKRRSRSLRPACVRKGHYRERPPASDHDGMVNSPDAPATIPARSPGSAPSTSPARDLPNWRSPSAAAGRACGRTARGEHPWFGQFRHRVRLAWGQGQMGYGPEGWIRIAVPPGQLDDFIRAVRQAARDTDAEYQALMARRRERASATHTLNARGRPTRPGVPAWQKIRPASTRYWPRPGSSSCCRAASSC